MITLYQDPLSTTSRPVLLFLAEHDLPVALKTVSLLAEEQKAPDYTALNPSQAVPFLVDDELAIGECSAILKYLADLAGSPAYPREPKARARVNWAMDWLNTGLSRDLNYGHVYPRMFPKYAWPDPAMQAAMLDRGLENGRRWLTILDEKILAHGGEWMLGDQFTIADYLGAEYVSLGTAVGFDLSPWPRVTAWLERMRARPSWAPSHAALDAFLEALRTPRAA